MSTYTLAALIQEALATGLLSNGPPADWMRLGLPNIDRAMAGIQPGTVGIIGGGTGSCKSTLLMHMALGERVHPMGLVSLEDGPGQLALRAVSQRAAIDSRALLREGMAGSHQEPVDSALRDLYDRPYPLFAAPLGATYDDVVNAVRRLATDGGCKLIAVDYLQKVRPHDTAMGASQDRRIDMMRLWSGLQKAAQECGCAILAATQLGRGYQRGEPSLQSPAESSSIEIESRFAMMAWTCRDAVRDHEIINVKLVKSMWGGVGAVDRFVRAEANLVHESQLTYRLQPEEIRDERSR
jgi:replicative DNA helicase